MNQTSGHSQTTNEDYLREVFGKYAHKGLLSRENFRTCLHLEFGALEADDIFLQLFDSTPNKQHLPPRVVNFEGFFSIFERNRERLQQVFSRLDINGDGVLSVSDLTHHLSMDQPQLANNPEHLQQMIQTLDLNKSGTIEFDEFLLTFQFEPLRTDSELLNQWMRKSTYGIDFGSNLSVSLPKNDPELSNAENFWRFVLAGGIGGVVTRTVTAPLERVKLQAMAFGVTSIKEELRSIFAKEGLRGLWAGNLANCLRIFPFSATICLVYANLVPYVGHHDFARASIGGFAGACAIVLTYPLDVLKARMTLKTEGAPRSLIRTVQHIVRAEGVSAFYSGMRPTFYAVVPFVALQQSIYDKVRLVSTETLKSFVNDSQLHRSVTSSPFFFLACGCVAGAAASAVTFPLDVLRLQYQMNFPLVSEKKEAQQHHPVHSGSSKYSAQSWRFPFFSKSLCHTNNKIGVFEGLRALNQQGLLYRGIRPTLLKVVPSVGISLMMRDWIKDTLWPRFHQH